MQAKAVLCSIVCLGVVVSGALLAQEGHPLVGSWHGDRGTNAKNRTDVTLIMDWNGTQLTGLVNPGFESMALQNAKLNPKDWSVHFEVDSKDASGKTIRCMVDGTIGRLGSDQRTLTGTWICGAVKQDFTVKRDRDYYRGVGEPQTSGK